MSLARKSIERKKDIPCDWRIVKVDQTYMCPSDWRAERKIDKLGFYYLYDANRHVHICSFTPTYELNALVGYATFTEDVSDEVRDEVDQENEMAEADQPVSYMNVSHVDHLPSQDANKGVDPPEEGEDREAYYERMVNELMEYYRSNHPGF
jgi:hypothetical protein